MSDNKRERVSKQYINLGMKVVELGSRVADVALDEHRRDNVSASGALVKALQHIKEAGTLIDGAWELSVQIEDEGGKGDEHS